ncbi:hypothetical protein [Amycolatopsis sp. SID8362]|uniref:hypothetical protein n=1 Tax=Amycolatopsis sp. SID8362 TaxID=2690346 RepID=UPI00136B7E2D|nr:hypothetical protein [Amycolatopsis sp. SID8362]NBH02177.1 hypothetical protein [Amycolatopsis sp. SID8362]NED38880.1 hypothetical protein [Amycolatopsis sp. SID8362]
MTIRPDRLPTPEPDDDEPLQRDGRQAEPELSTEMGRMAALSVDNPERGFDGQPVERRDERREALAFASRILSSWGYTARMIVLVGTLLAILVSGIGLLQLTVDLGPVRVSGTTSVGDSRK